MAKTRTPEAGVPLMTTIGRALGRRGSDIQLPSSGKKDPRLPASLADTHHALKEAGRGLSTVRNLTRKR